MWLHILGQKHEKRLTAVNLFSWLERRGIVQTFDDTDPLKLEHDIIEIRELLKESDEHKESSQC